jgi:hypothetical protein
MSLAILLNGARGRMGQAVAAAADTEGVRLNALVDVGDDPAPFIDGCDVVVDFSSPAATAGLLERQTAAFAGALLPEHAGRVAVAHYEGLVRLLQTCAGEEARAVGAFVAGLLPAAAAAPRTTTARELRRRAVAERRARGAAIGPAEDDAAAPRTMAP